MIRIQGKPNLSFKFGTWWTDYKKGTDYSLVQECYDWAHQRKQEADFFKRHGIEKKNMQPFAFDPDSLDSVQKRFDEMLEIFSIKTPCQSVLKVAPEVTIYNRDAMLPNDVLLDLFNGRTV
jgi:hypothetical protein